MKLFYAPNSPYARKARIVAREKGLLGQITEIITLPADRPPELRAANPLGKVPALILDDGSALFDSPVICEYLDQLPPGPQLFPTGSGRWRELTMQALADGVMDVAVAAVMELRRPPEEQSASSLEHWCGQMRSAVSEMHQELAMLEADLSIGQIAAASALAYLDFRHPDLQWRNSAEQVLIDWYQEFAARQSMLETAPLA